MIKLWEIFVPIYSNLRARFPIEHHLTWDNFVCDNAGGLTLHSVLKGKYKSTKEGTDFTDEVIPVRIACTEEQMEKIAEFSASHYEQEAILYYKISDEVRIWKRQK